jgi:hypothetical protein
LYRKCKGDQTQWELHLERRKQLYLCASAAAAKPIPAAPDQVKAAIKSFRAFALFRVFAPYKKK